MSGAFRMMGEETAVDTLVMQLPHSAKQGPSAKGGAGYQMMIGQLIGKGGCNLDRLRHVSGARIIFDTDRGTATISGSPEQIQIAKAKLLEQIQAPVEAVVTLPPDSKDLMGSLIGKGGCHIKQILADSGANLRLDTNAGTATIRGLPQQVEVAQDLLLHRLEAARAAVEDHRKRANAVDREYKSTHASMRGQPAKKLLRHRITDVNEVPKTQEQRDIYRAVATAHRQWKPTETARRGS